MKDFTFYLDDETIQKCMDYCYNLIMHTAYPEEYENLSWGEFGLHLVEIATFNIIEDLDIDEGPYPSPKDVDKIIKLYEEYDEYEKCQHLLGAKKVVRDKYADWKGEINYKMDCDYWEDNF